MTRIRFHCQSVDGCPMTRIRFHCQSVDGAVRTESVSQSVRRWVEMKERYLTSESMLHPITVRTRRMMRFELDLGLACADVATKNCVIYL